MHIKINNTVSLVYSHFPWLMPDVGSSHYLHRQRGKDSLLSINYTSMTHTGEWRLLTGQLNMRLLRIYTETIQIQSNTKDVIHTKKLCITLLRLLRKVCNRKHSISIHWFTWKVKLGWTKSIGHLPQNEYYSEVEYFCFLCKQGDHQNPPSPSLI